MGTVPKLRKTAKKGFSCVLKRELTFFLGSRHCKCWNWNDKILRATRPPAFPPPITLYPQGTNAHIRIKQIIKISGAGSASEE